MKAAFTLISLGILILVAALGTWAYSRPSHEVGDPARFERALTGPEGMDPPAAGPTPETGRVALDTQELPGFTIGQATDDPGKVPVAIRIPALGEEAVIVPAGVEPNGDMEVPDNAREVAWYRYGAAPGEPGSAVLAAHVDLAGRGPGVFFGLGSLQPGDFIFVDFDDGSTGAWIAEARATYEKDELPTDAIFGREGPPVLTLVTCGGEFNRSIRRYDSNVVVYAVPADTVPLPFL